MEGEVKNTTHAKPRFSVYQNHALSAALTAKSLRPSKPTLLFVFLVSVASSVALLVIISRGDDIIHQIRHLKVSDRTAYIVTKILQLAISLLFIITSSAFIRALSLRKARNTPSISFSSSLSNKGEKEILSERQQCLLGLKLKPSEKIELETIRKLPKGRSYPSSSPSNMLVPIHHSSSSHSPGIGSEKLSKTSSKPVSPLTSSPYLVSPVPVQSPLITVSPSMDRQIQSPWLKHKSTLVKGIPTEELLEQFLADVDKKLVQLTEFEQMTTPSPGHGQLTPPTLHSYGISSPGVVSGSITPSGTARSTPLRPVRMSPGSQTFKTPPKKGEGEFPSPMSMEQAIGDMEDLGVYPIIEQWRDGLRQWFSSVLLKPLFDKIETSHLQVMQAASRIGISVTVTQVGKDPMEISSTPSLSTIDEPKKWKTASALDEDAILHQLRAILVQTLDTSSKYVLPNSEQRSQNPLVPIMQECVDAITEHQRLHALLKGEGIKGLLPQSSIRADYVIQRIHELADGTCLKKFEYLGNGEIYDKVNKKWTRELPTDSHLLLYLFCAFLEHPKWMLHVDPTSHASAQSSRNPLFLGILPPKERSPEKYLAVLSSVPSFLHPGACVLVVGKQSPPIFALYWDKKLQFSLQGRTALWDAILLFCHRIKVGYGGIIRGLHLGSAFNILPILDSEDEE